MEKDFAELEKKGMTKYLSFDWRMQRIEVLKHVSVSSTNPLLS